MSSRLFTSAIGLLAIANSPFTSALTIPNLDDVLSPSILGGGHALIDLDVLANVLGPSQCSSTALVGIQAEISLFNILHICACIEVLNLDSKHVACPQCVANSHPICGTGQCGCECDAGFYSFGGSCVPISHCPSPNTLVKNRNRGNSQCDCKAPLYKSDNASGCVCASPYVPGVNGGCVLPPSIRARQVRAKKSQVQLAVEAASPAMPTEAIVFEEVKDEATVMFNEARCPYGETACPVGSGDGYECLDLTTSLDSCGGCPTRGGVNCLTLSGALGVACVESKCEILSCFPGWRYSKGGRCVRLSPQ